MRPRPEPRKAPAAKQYARRRGARPMSERARWEAYEAAKRRLPPTLSGQEYDQAIARILRDLDL